jgi:non-heme chloroperoxidase
MLSCLLRSPDTYADDLYALFEHLDLKDVCMVGHSTGGGEVARFLGRHGTDRVRKAVLVSAICPLMLQNDTNPKGLPKSVFDGFKAAMEKDRAQWFIDIPTGPFFGFNREGAKVSQGMIWAWWQQGMTTGFKGAHDCITVFSETDMREDLKKIDIPVLVIHG